MPLTTSTVTNANATPDPPPELEPNPSPPSSPTDYLATPQTDYLAMNQNELSQHNIVEHRNWKKKLLTVVIVTSPVVVFVVWICFGNIQNLLVNVLDWMAIHTTLAVFCFIFMFVISTRK